VNTPFRHMPRLGKHRLCFSQSLSRDCVLGATRNRPWADVQSPKQCKAQERWCEEQMPRSPKSILLEVNPVAFGAAAEDVRLVRSHKSARMSRCCIPKSLSSTKAIMRYLRPIRTPRTRAPWQFERASTGKNCKRAPHRRIQFSSAEASPTSRDWTSA